MLSVALLALGLSAAAPRSPAPAPADVAEAEPSSFVCGDRKLLLRFGAVHAQPVVVVDAGDGPHTLPAQPWDSEQRELRWSDGSRTLTWGTGVHLMYMADGGDTHLMCGRAGGHHH